MTYFAFVFIVVVTYKTGMAQLQSLSGILPSEILLSVILKTHHFSVKFYNGCDWNKLDAIDLKVIGLLTHLSTCTNHKLNSPSNGDMFCHKEIKNIKASCKNHTSHAWIDTKIYLTFLFIIIIIIIIIMRYGYLLSQIFSSWYFSWTSGDPHRSGCMLHTAVIIIIIIIIIIIEFLTSQLWLGNIHLSWDVLINRIRLSGLICSLKSFSQLNMCQELQIFADVRIYLFGCKLSLVRLCDCDFGITPVDDNTIGITCAAFCFHRTHILFASSWYFFCLSVIVLARLCVFGTAMSIKKMFFVFLFIKIMSGRLKGFVYYYYY